MRLSVVIPCFYGGQDLCGAIEKIAALGYDAAETYDWKGLDFPRVREACERHGVELVSVCTTHFNMTDPAKRAEWLKGLEESCEAANKLGAGKLITQCGPDTGMPRSEQRRSISQALKEAGPILAEHAVTLMIEPLNALVDHPGCYLTGSEEAFSIVREAGDEHVKMVFDIYHQQVMEGNIIPNITANLDCIAHLHAAGHPGRHELQAGENDYRVIFAAAGRAGYGGCCGLEYKPLTDTEESLREARRLYG